MQNYWLKYVLHNIFKNYYSKSKTLFVNQNIQNIEKNSQWVIVCSIKFSKLVFIHFLKLRIRKCTGTKNKTLKNMMHENMKFQKYKYFFQNYFILKKMICTFSSRLLRLALVNHFSILKKYNILYIQKNIWLVQPKFGRINQRIYFLYIWPIF